ncbi:hypothetical protein FSP39_013668 [Pinctada imbricata]|uniref:guanylate cyclase n=1 Tax=Pinctada imbricata TaxID=66713 RepID=A0AA88Y4E0_PINIB|nr:hypothetical protein FSP39_013668 [Pinctada imbricata]
MSVNDLESNKIPIPSFISGGITGYVAVDDKGDREPDYWVWDLQPGWTKFRHIMEIQMTNSSSSSQGIIYINQSPLRIHGNLKSSNCVVDNRWVLKLTDFGLNFRRNGYRKRFLSEYQLYSGLYWTAPENLQADNTCHSCKGDVYSFGIILFEMLYRTQPYETLHTTPKEVINRLLRREKPCFRPTVSHGIKEGEDKVSLGIPRWAFVLMQSSWQQDPNLRPSPTEIKAVIIRGGGGKRLNIMDNMISMLEKYANNLEDIVEQRTGQLLEEKKKTDLLLYRMLPTTVADRLKRGDMVEAEIFGSVTIYFSDIVGFTDMSSSSTPIEIVAFLNDLYTLFDSIIGRFDVYKVETIGDAYMVVSGLPVRNGDNHVTEIAKMSLKLLESMDNFTIRHKPGMKLRIRIGLHTGSCAAGRNYQ